MEEPHRAIDKVHRLADTLSRMAEPLGYGIVVASDCSALGLYRLSDEKKNWTAAICCVPFGGTKESSAKALLRKYESLDYCTVFFYDSFDSVTFPGGSLEVIELKAAAGWTARLERN